MPRNWSKGLTKQTHPSLLKTSQTMKRKRLDNFKEWRERMKRDGKIKAGYPDYTKNVDLAELIGVVLGDGHIESCPRTERLLIAANSSNIGFVERYRNLVRKVIFKEPAVTKEIGRAHV